MKKTFESGKIWTILSALLFFMTCGVFIVHAAGSSNNGLFTQKYNTGTLNNTLTATGWNQLMGDLDNLIPDGAVMAFLTDSCPNGWNEFTGANGRFLMGTLGQDFGYTGGAINNKITLTTNQLPSHNHRIKYINTSSFGDADEDRYVAVDYSTNYGPLGGHNGAARGQNVNNNIKYLNTAPTGSGNSINIAPSYIKVHYCVKGTSSLVEDTCPEGYSSNITTCGEGYKLSQKPSTFGSMSCGKCSPSCEEKYPFTELCSLKKGELYGGGVGVVSVGFDGGSFTCVRPGCCGSKKADFTESFPSLLGEKDRETELSNLCM